MDLVSKEKREVFKGGDFMFGRHSVWAYSTKYIVVKANSTEVAVLNRFYEKRDQFELQSKINHIIHQTGHNFIILCQKVIYKLDPQKKQLSLIKTNFENCIISSGIVSRKKFLVLDIEKKIKEGDEDQEPCFEHKIYSINIEDTYQMNTMVKEFTEISFTK